MTKSRLPVIFTLLVVAAAGGGVWWMQSSAPATTGKSGGGRNRLSDQPIPVTVTPAKITDIPVYLEGVGTVKARNTVTVRPQVDGRLLSVNFKEGDNVNKGDILAKIDPVTFQAQLEQAEAKKALDEALLANTKRDLERYQKVGTIAQSQQQIDTQAALVRQQEAQIKADQAAIDNAAAILGYTTIAAPLSGRTGMRLVDEGNIVHASDATGLVTITEVQPISVVFTLPQQQLPQIRKGDAAGQLTAEAFTTDGKSELDSGTMQVIDNQIDPATGTVRLKADFPNANLQLWPGQFVNVRLLVDTLSKVVVVPVPAIQRGPAGSFVYVAADDGKVTSRPVVVGQQTDTDAVITSGLEASEKVVTSGFGQLSDGAKIAISDGTTPAPATTKPDHPHNGEHRHRRDNASIE